MIEKIDLSKHMDKKEYKERTKQLDEELSLLQRRCKEMRIPVIIVFEGWGASGKGRMINRLIEPLDPRGFCVYTTGRASEEEMARPFLWRFVTKTPARGRIAIFDRSWYRRVLQDRMDGMTSNQDIQYAYDEIINFEKILTDDGAVIIKFFLHITKQEQEKRFEKLINNSKTAWRVTHADWEHNRNYEEYLKIIDETLVKTDQSFAPWTVIEAINKEYASAKILQTVVDRLSEVCTKLDGKSKIEKENQSNKDMQLTKEGEKEKLRTNNQSLEDRYMHGVLSAVNLSLDLSKNEYKDELKELQKKLALLHHEMYLKKVPMILVFEGWDAAGKGGAIKRVTSHLDTRGYEVVPIAAPKDCEKAHHYLWRFWEHMPKKGHLAIFDRSWYGRVMVERVEGFCNEEEWKRAYSEINHMEEHIANAGAIIIKFFLHIDPKEQEKRFKKRQETPGKQWKITKEDWRNRSKWEEYERAIDEMIVRTSTNYAPWIVIEANSKPYARVKVLKTIVDELENRLEKS